MEEGLSKKLIVVLGHKGMLGQMCVRYFRKVKHIELMTYDEHRYSPLNPLKYINGLKTHLDAAPYLWNNIMIINAIGRIPQKHPDATLPEYVSVNVTLPLLLAKTFTGCKIIFPSTDCVFSGTTPSATINRHAYSATDPKDAYGLSKALMEEALVGHENAIVIRASIIGPYSDHGLLGWFLSREQDAIVKGYTNHMWNGVTSLQWCRFVHDIIHLDRAPVVNYGTKEIYSKYDILIQFAEAFGRSDVTITPTATPVSVYRNLHITLLDVPPLRTQLQELKRFMEVEEYLQMAAPQSIIRVYNADTFETEERDINQVLKELRLWE